MNLPNPVIRSHYGNGFIKQYVRDHLILRTEPASNNVHDYGVNKSIQNLPALRNTLSAIIDNYLNVQQDILETFVDRGQLRRLAEPTITPTGRRIPGLRLDHPRQLALMHALVRFAHIAAGNTFTTAEIQPYVIKALGCPSDRYTLASLRYDLSKLRAKGLVAKLPNSRRYRPQIATELRALIRRMSIENPLWGAPRIHGELLKLGFEVAQSSVAKYMVKRRGPPSQGWRTFLHNHAPDIAAMDLFVVPTIGFDLLYAFVVVRLGRRDLVWINVTAYPTADWVARQITEAFPWNEAPRYMIRDRDRIYGAVVTRRLRAMGIRDKPTHRPLDPARECRSCDCPGRGASASHSEILRPILQRSQNASVFEQGCARISLGTARRCYSFTRHPWR